MKQNWGQIVLVEHTDYFPRTMSLGKSLKTEGLGKTFHVFQKIGSSSIWQICPFSGPFEDLHTVSQFLNYMYGQTLEVHSFSIQRGKLILPLFVME